MATQVTQVSGQQSIPTELMPYFTGTGTAGEAGYVPGLLPKGQEIFAKDYATTYAPLIGAGLSGAGGIASLSPMQQQVGAQIGQMGTPTQFAAGQTTAQQAQGLYGTAPQVGAANLTQYQLSPTQTFDQGIAQQYMSPYMQSVTDIAKNEAMRDYQKNLVGQNLTAARQGTYGGARNLLAQTEGNRNLQSQLQGIQARGLQDAFTNAQTQFERDRAAGFQTGNVNLQAALGVQQLGAGQSLEAQKANQTAQLQAATGLANLGDMYTRAGTAQQASDIDRLKTMGAYGDLERAYQQQVLDAQKDELTRQSEFGASQLGSMANLLRGVPLYQSSETKATTTPPPSFASQLGGLGLTGLSMYNMLK
jgi:hypothetical protein